MSRIPVDFAHSSFSRPPECHRAQPRIDWTEIGHRIGEALGNGITAAVFALALYRWLA